MKLKVLLVDSDERHRLSLAAQLLQIDPEIEIVGQASNGIEGIRMALALLPDVILIELHARHTNGITATQILRKAHSASKIIIVSGCSHTEFTLPAAKAGALGYLQKTVTAGVVWDELMRVQRAPPPDCWILEQVLISMRLNLPHNRVFRQMDVNEDPLVTIKEVQVLQLLAEGLSVAQIADLIRVNRNTAGQHRGRISRKLELHFQDDLVSYARVIGIIATPEELPAQVVAV